MKIQELPSPYRELAEMRREQLKTCEWSKRHCYDFERTNDFIFAFQWKATAEGDGFWNEVDDGNLPKIPASSLAKLAEWQKKEPTQKTETLIGGKTDAEWLYIFAGQAMQGVLANRELQLACYKDNPLNGTTHETAIAFRAIKEAQALLTKLKEVENA